MTGFRETLREQRWDDHRYYHHSRINQSLHLVSAISFLIAYVMVFFDPGATLAACPGQGTNVNRWRKNETWSCRLSWRNTGGTSKPYRRPTRRGESS